MRIRVLDIVEGTSVDGPGLRTSIYLAGCHHRCPGCHNPESWAMDGGREASVDELLNTIRYNDFNVTLSGGDPLYHPKEVAELCRRIKQELGKTVWCFTGFTWDEIQADPALQLPLEGIDAGFARGFDGMAYSLDAAIFIEALRDTQLRFRGSPNQRIVDVAASRGKTIPVELTEYY